MSLPSLNLDAFFACARLGNFTQAAESLYITQSALSQRVAKLETELGTTLIIRAPQGLQLTPAGEELLRYCLAKESLEGESLQRITGHKDRGLSGTIRVGGFSSIMRSVVLPSLAPLLQSNPQLKLKFITKEMNELPDLLRFGEIDYMIHYQPIYKDEIETLHLADEINVLVQKKGYRGPDFFLDHDERDQATAQYLKKNKNKKLYERRYLDDVYGLIDGVKMGLGRALIPLHLIENQKGLEIIEPKKNIQFPVILHFYKQSFYTQLHRDLLACLKKAVPEKLGAKPKV